MSCKRWAGDLADAVAGEVDTTGLQAHLRECEACRTRLDDGRRVLAAVDRDMAEALAVEPSADLLARVRERVAGSRPAPVASLGLVWRIAAAVAVAAGVAGALWLLRPAVPEGQPGTASALPPVPVDSPGQPDATVTAPTGAVGTQATTTQPATAKRRASASPVRRVSISSGEPEVLMPRGEAALLGRFVTILRTRTVEPSSLLMARSDESLPELKPIDVSPLEIRPLSEDIEPADDGRME